MARDVLDLGAKGSQAVELCKLDFNFFAALVDPHQFRHLFPAFYITLFRLLTGFLQPIERFAIGIPRGFAKTTYIKLMCVWYILFTAKKFILIVGASEKLALNTVSDICDMLGAANIRRLFGAWDSRIEEDTKEQKVFYFRGRWIIIKGIGAGTSVRGINRKNERPDVIIMDDIQKREDADNEQMADDLLTWMLGTLGLAKSNDGCTFIFIGNMYPKNSILEKLRQDPEWTSLVVGGILADGTSLWEELKPLDGLLSDYRTLKNLGKENIFVAEILNNSTPIILSGLDLTKIRPAPEWMTELEAEGSYILIDPSSGKKDGDDCTISHVSIVDGISVVDEQLPGTFSPLETITHTLGMGMRRGTRLIVSEDVAYQGTLLFWFKHYCNTEGISGFEFQPVSPKNKAKNNRIKSGLLRAIAQEVYLAQAVYSPIITQATEWNPLKTDNKDDRLEVIGYDQEVRQLYPDLIVKLVFETDADVVPAAHDDTIQLPF